MSARVKHFALIGICMLAMQAFDTSLAWSDDFSNDQTITSAEVQPLVWEPMIVEFSASGEHASSSIITPPTDLKAMPADVLGESNQWSALKLMIAPRGDVEKGIPALDANVNVLSAWKRIITEDGKVEFRAYGSNGTKTDDGSSPAPGGSSIHQIYSADKNVMLCFDLDVLMNRDPVDKDKLLRDWFQLAEVHVSAIKISDDPAHFRDAFAAAGMASRDPNRMANPVLNLGKQEDVTGENFFDRMHSWVRGQSAATWNFAQNGSATGVYEFQIMARVLGRSGNQEKIQSKSVSGAIRVAFVNDKNFEFNRLSFDEARKPGETDTIKNGLLNGTTQVKKPR